MDMPQHRKTQPGLVGIHMEDYHGEHLQIWRLKIQILPKAQLIFKVHQEPHISPED